MIYSIHSRITGEVLISAIELPEDRVENLSGDSSEGFFRADQLDELSELGEKVVYAIFALG